MTPHDDRSPETEDRLRAILRSRADEVEPAHDAYTRLAVRVTTEPQRGRPRWRQRQLVAVPMALCLLAVAAAVVLLTGDDGGQRIDTVSAPVPSPPVSGGPAVAAPVFPGDDRTGWFPSAEAAGRSFATTILGEPELVLEPVVDGRIPVRGRGEGGTPTGVIGSLAVVEERSDDGRSRYGIAGAEVDSIAIGSPSSGSSITGPLRVSGTSSSFEGSLHLTVRTMDGTVLGTALAQGGAGIDLEPFRAEVDLHGWGQAFVVVSSDSAADGATGRHAAVAVDIEDPSAATYVVVRVEPDDPDGGLVVRSAPDARAAPVGVLAPGATGIHRIGPTDGAWWQVTDGSVEGWVNSSYLAVDVRLDADRSAELEQLAADAARAVAERDAEALAALPWDPDHRILLGWAGDPDQVEAEALQAASFWTSTRTFPLPDAFDPATVEATFFDFVDPGRSATHPVGVDDCCTYGVSDRIEVRALRHGSFRSGSDTTNDWTVTRLYADWTSGELRIAAVLVERWEP